MTQPPPLSPGLHAGLIRRNSAVIRVFATRTGRISVGWKAQKLRLLQNLVSAGPWPSAALPRASSALRIQSRRTNRGRSPGYGICKQWLNRRARRPCGSPQTEGRQGIRASWGRARSLTEEVAPAAGPPQTSRDRPPVRGILGHLTRWWRRSRTCHDAAARGGLRYGGRPDRYPTTRRGRPGPGKYRTTDPTRSAGDATGGRHNATGSGSRMSRRHANPRGAVSSPIPMTHHSGLSEPAPGLGKLVHLRVPA